jgi:hypothetical protein
MATVYSTGGITSTSKVENLRTRRIQYGRFPVSSHFEEIVLRYSEYQEYPTTYEPVQYTVRTGFREIYSSTLYRYGTSTSTHSTRTSKLIERG